LGANVWVSPFGRHCLSAHRWGAGTFGHWNILSAERLGAKPSHDTAVNRVWKFVWWWRRTTTQDKDASHDKTCDDKARRCSDDEWQRIRTTLTKIVCDICQLIYYYDFIFNDMQINYDNVPGTKHGAQTSGAQMAAPKCHVPILSKLSPPAPFHSLW